MIRQLSVFVENKPGNLVEITEALTDAAINIRAIATFDTPEFGILRLVVDKPRQAKEYLTSKGFVVRLNEVISVELVDEKGAINNMLKKLAEAEVNLDYIYSFVIRQGKAPIMVFHTDNCEKAVETLKQNKANMIEEEDL